MIVWITGASGGLGAALAATALAEAARVIDLSNQPGAPPGVEHVHADLSEPETWPRVGEHFRAELAGQRDRAVLVQGAATIQPIGFAGEVDPVAYRRQVLLDVAAPLVLGEAFLAACREAGCAADLVMVTSRAAIEVGEGTSAYCAGKAAVDQWVRTVGAEQARRGQVRVLAVTPGSVDTGMQRALRDAAPGDLPDAAAHERLHAGGGLRSPAEAAAGIWALVASDVPGGTVLHEPFTPS